MTKEMNCFVGIDLGSTTTKAVIVDETDKIIGRGITNSRSNYDIACTVARTEAFINARFSLFRTALEAQALSVDIETVMKLLEVYFRREQHLSQFDQMKSEIFEEAIKEKYKDYGSALADTLNSMFEKMHEMIDEEFQPDAKKRSDFFRDICGAQYAKASESHADPEGVHFDLLMSLYDKCILRVENHALDLSFSVCIGSAFEKMLKQLKMDSETEDRVTLQSAVQHSVDTVLAERNTVGTGYGRARLPFPKEQIRSEILCHGLGAHIMFPKTATVLDIGGQDTKAIQVDERGIVTSFQMNDRCAAGCGRYLGYIADEMNLGLHELGPMANKACSPVKINSTCTVFAGAELRERLALGQRREDILAGLHRAIILRAMSLLARSGGIKNEFTFTGGVANNVAAVDALQKLVIENYGEGIQMNISADSIYTGALGAAIFARRDGQGVAMDSPESSDMRKSA